MSLGLVVLGRNLVLVLVLVLVRFSRNFLLSLQITETEEEVLICTFENLRSTSLLFVPLP